MKKSSNDNEVYRAAEARLQIAEMITKPAERVA
jgi:hypothetical protein